MTPKNARFTKYASKNKREKRDTCNTGLSLPTCA